LVQTPNQVRYPEPNAGLDQANLVREFLGRAEAAELALVSETTSEFAQVTTD